MDEGYARRKRVCLRQGHVGTRGACRRQLSKLDIPMPLCNLLIASSLDLQLACQLQTQASIENSQSARHVNYFRDFELRLAL